MPLSKKFIKHYDRFIYAIAVLIPIAHLPQVFKVWSEKDASGVSSLSWFLFAASSLAWLIYGIIHKDSRLTLMYAALSAIQMIIAVGALIYG